MSTYHEAHDPQRREFLRTAALTTIAAAASGTGAAAIVRRTTPPAAPPLPAVVAPQPAAPLLTPQEDLADLFARLTAAEADNVRLRAELDAARRNLTATQNGLQSDAGQSEALTQALDDATRQIGLLGGLVALYEQMDDGAYAALLDEGLTAVTTSLNNLVANSPALTEGVAVGRQALNELEEQLALVDNGRRWLESHQAKLQAYFAALEELLRGAVERIGPFLEMVEQWFADLHKWLPFNLGRRAADIMAAAANLLGETPHTLSGLETNVIQPLAPWLAQEEGETRLRRHLITPLRQQVLDNAQRLAEETAQLQTTLQENVAQPWQTAVEQQQQARQRIAQYRQENQV